MRVLLIASSLALLLCACVPDSLVSPEAWSPTSVFTPTNTPRVHLTTTSQSTLETATAVPFPTATQTAIPTFTPATPAVDGIKSYKLREWTPGQADLLIDQISSQLSAIEGDPIYSSVYGYSAYMDMYRYLIFAEREALLRFPDAPEAETWHWDLCFNLAFAYHYAESPDALELPCYAELIEDGLNSGQTNIPGLSSWFATHEPRFSLESTSHPPPLGYTSSHVISLASSANLWLLEKEGDFQAFGLRSSMFFFRESGSKFQLLDLTGDNYPELMLYFSRATCCNSFSQQFIYELSSGTPKLLSLEDLNGISTHTTSEYDSYITALESSAELPGLLFKGQYGADALTQPCNLREYAKYYWNGDRFELAETWFGIDEPDTYDDKDFCEFVIDTAKERGELDVAVKAIGNAPISDPEPTGDQILYRLGEYHARLGHKDKAKDFFTQAIDFSAKSKESDTKWAESAQLFLDNYSETNDYYEVCSQAAQCDMRSALEQLITETKADSFIQAISLLKASGISIKSNAVLNFDGIDTEEQWFVVQHPNRSGREFWILVRGLEKIYGLFVAEITTNKPEIKEFQGSDTYALMTSDGEYLFSLERLNFSGQPYVMTYESIENHDPFLEDDYAQDHLIEESLESMINQLMSGSNPAPIRDLLIQLGQSTSFDCKAANRGDQIQYLLGLTYELLGHEQAALDAYLQLWKEYPESFYTIMVRSKLVLTSP